MSLQATRNDLKQRAWIQLFQAYGPVFLAYLRRHYNRYPAADHDAIVNAAFMRASENLSNLIAANSRHAYFWRIFINAISDFSREQIKDGLSSTLEVAQERVIESLKLYPLGFDIDSVHFIAKTFRSHQDDLDRASSRVYRMAKRQGQRITLALARDALVDFETESAEAGANHPLDLENTEIRDPAMLVDLNRLSQEFEDCFQRTMAEYRELHPHRQKYIDLRVMAGLTNAEIEKALGRSSGATREFLSQCRQKFQQLLEKLCGPHAVVAAEEML